MSRFETRLTITLLVGLMVAPWVAGLLGLRPTTAENRPLTALPDLGASQLLDADTYSQLDRFLVDHTPLRREVASATNSALVELSGESPLPNVFLGTDDTLFLAEDFVQPCAHEYAFADLAALIAEWEAVAAGLTSITLAIAPDKSAILPTRLDVRSRLGNDCQQARHQEFDEVFAGGDDALELRGRLRSYAEANSTDHTYYRYDSHWTFRGATLYAEALVESLAPGQFDVAEVVDGPPFVVQADIARRLGWDRTETRPRLELERPGVVTELIETNVGGTRTVRSYTSTATGPSGLIDGRTIVVHDSMNNFAESVIAPHFEHIEFVHWNDLVAGEFWRRITDADHIVIETVERQSHVRIAQTILGEEFTGLMRAGLSVTPAQRLRSDFASRISVIREASGNDVENPSTIPGFGSQDHPVFGSWAGARLEYCDGDECGFRLVLTDITLATLQELQSLIDREGQPEGFRMRIDSDLQLVEAVVESL